MASAYIFEDIDGSSWTEVRNSEGEIVKIIPTDPSQIRKPRESLLFKPDVAAIPKDRHMGTIGYALAELEETSDD